MNKKLLLLFSLGLLILGFIEFPRGSESWDTLKFSMSRGYYYTVGQAVFRAFLWSAIFFIGFCEVIIKDKISDNRSKKYRQESIKEANYKEELRIKKEKEIIEKMKTLNILFNETDPHYKNEFIYSTFEDLKKEGYNLINIVSGDDVYKLVNLKRQFDEKNIHYNKNESIDENIAYLTKINKYKTGIVKLQNKIDVISNQYKFEFTNDLDLFIKNNPESIIEDKIISLINIIVEDVKLKSVKEYPIVFKNDYYITFNKGTYKESIMLNDINGKYNIEENYIIEMKTIKELESEFNYYSKLYFPMLNLGNKQIT